MSAGSQIGFFSGIATYSLGHRAVPPTADELRDMSAASLCCDPFGWMYNDVMVLGWMTPSQLSHSVPTFSYFITDYKESDCIYRVKSLSIHCVILTVLWGGRLALIPPHLGSLQSLSVCLIVFGTQIWQWMVICKCLKWTENSFHYFYSIWSSVKHPVRAWIFLGLRVP